MDQKEHIKILASRIQSLEIELKKIKLEMSGLESSSDEENLPAAAIAPELHKKIQADKTSQNNEHLLSKNSEFFLGGNLFGKLGFLAIVLAAGWFIKFAIDRQWLNESARVYSGITGGYAILALSIYYARKFLRILPPVGAGAGFAVLFLTIFGAYYFYDLIDMDEAFALLFFLVLWSAFLAYTADSESLYTFSIIGAFLSPVLLSTGENSYRFLFAYLTAINSIFFAISFRRSWRIAPFTVILANHLMYYVWAENHLDESNPYIPAIFLFILFLQFFLREISLMPRITSMFRMSSVALFYINILLFLTAILDIMNSGSRETFITGRGFVSPVNKYALLFVLAASLILAAQIFLEKNIRFKNILPATFRSSLLIAWTVLLTTSLFQIFDGHWEIAGVITAAGMLLYTGTILHSEFLKLSSLPFFGTAVLYLLFFFDFWPREYIFILNERMLLFSLITFPLIGIYRLQIRRENSDFPHVITLAGFTFSAVISLLYEVHDFIDHEGYRSFSYSLVLALFSAAFFIAGFYRRNRDLRMAGILFAGMIVLKLYLYDIWMLGLLVRIIALFSLGALLVLVSFFYNKFQIQFRKET